ncbi:DUF3563 family protein [Mangrovicella endophytica]|uniref:DUF3563 family protein n=1 Tax=Mangrovicella endophytica TaxID=2066697 RepID=UPI000DF14555|nr:DUF3563 family protein [Mangrovicella endophytica]
MGLTSRIRDAVKRRREYNPELEYLNEATSLVDLERRQREIDQGRFRRSRYPY